jgi:hypothetical protein
MKVRDFSLTAGFCTYIVEQLNAHKIDLFGNHGMPTAIVIYSEYGITKNS